MNYCGECGNKLSNDSPVCSACGTEVRSSANNQPESPELVEQTYIVNKEQVDIHTNMQSEVHTVHSEQVQQQSANQEASSKKKLNLKWVFGGIAFLLAAGALIGFFIDRVVIVNQKVATVMDEVRNQNYDTALERYEEIGTGESIRNGESVVSKMNDQLLSYTDEIMSSYEDGAITTEEAIKQMEGIAEFSPVTETAEQQLESLEETLESEELFKQAQDLRGQKKYFEAVEKIDEVIAASKKNAADAEKLKSDLTKEMYDHYMNTALNEQFAQKQYAAAILTLEKLNSYYPEDTKIVEELEKVKKDWHANILHEVNQLITHKKYNEAEKILASSLNIFPADSVFEKKKTEVAAAKEKRVNELKKQVAYDHNKELGITTISPKGSKPLYVNLDNKTNIEPKILITKDNKASFQVTVGFQQENWIFFDRVFFSVDGETFEWEINPLERYTEVIWGGIAEWYSKASINDADLVPQMKKVAEGKDVQIRFRGDKNREHTVTAKEKQQLKNMLELYESYENFDGLLPDIQ